MKNRTELMADLIVKADWLIENGDKHHLVEWEEMYHEYTRLRAELAEVKDGTGMGAEDLCKCGIPTPDADRECCTICGKLICGE